MNFVLIHDSANKYSPYFFCAAIIGFILVHAYFVLKSLISKGVKKKTDLRIILYVPFALFLFVFAIFNFYESYRERQYLLSAPRKTVVGCVTKYLPDYGHGKDESFEVEAVRFHYSFSRPTFAFNHSNSEIHEGLYVRIEYVDDLKSADEHAIVKLEIIK